MYLVFKIDTKRNREGLGTFPDEKIADVISELETFCEEGETIFAMQIPTPHQTNAKTSKMSEIFIKNTDGSISLKG